LEKMTDPNKVLTLSSYTISQGYEKIKSID